MANKQTSMHTKGAIGAEAGVMFGDGVWLFPNAGVPSNGTSGTGAGFAGPGSICVDTTNGELYTNQGTKSSPTWVNQT
jgi:hypothetical protein